MTLTQCNRKDAKSSKHEYNTSAHMWHAYKIYSDCDKKRTTVCKEQQPTNPNKL